MRWAQQRREQRFPPRLGRRLTVEATMPLAAVAPSTRRQDRE
jgi:hypothetical protein